jgi:molybdenum cofactor cytidylyltransferase
MNPFSELSCLCLAAGQSSRMGDDHKLLKKLGERSVIETVIRQLIQVSFAEIIVVTGARSEEIRDVLSPYPIRFVHNPEYLRGLHSSIRVGVDAMADNLGFFICLGDQPFSLRERILSFAQMEWDRSSLIRSVVTGIPGHPVLIGSNYKNEILATSDRDSGASYLFQKYDFETLEQPEAALWDLDTHDDFKRYGPLRSLAE